MLFKICFQDKYYSADLKRQLDLSHAMHTVCFLGMSSSVKILKATVICMHSVPMHVEQL